MASQPRDTSSSSMQPPISTSSPEPTRNVAGSSDVAAQEPPTLNLNHPGNNSTFNVGVGSDDLGGSGIGMACPPSEERLSDERAELI